LSRTDRIVLPGVRWQEIIEHCTRKLERRYLAGETIEPKAYGLLAGTQRGDTLFVEQVLQARSNLRNEEPYKAHVDMMIEKHPEPSTIPMSRRGWVIDPTEFLEMSERCERDGILVAGTYHMHRTPWGDDRRDTPTPLDAALAASSGMISFIVSMVDPENPLIRAFYEGIVESEIPVRIFTVI